MLHDPIVDRRLTAFGFDTRGMHLAEASNLLAQLERLELVDPSDGKMELRWCAIYVSHLMDWETIERAKGGQLEDAFRKRFDEKYPGVAKEANELKTLVDTIGFDTPEKMTELLGTIVRKHNLVDFSVDC